MELGTCALIDQYLQESPFEFQFTTKPVIFGGLAMEYYGLRKHGADMDFIVSYQDYDTLAAMYPDCRKDSWGDLGLLVNGYEMFRTVWKLDLAYIAEGSVEFRDYRVISLDKLLLMKALAQNAGEKHIKDLELIARHLIERHQREDAKVYMDAHIESYLKSPDGFVYGGKY